MWGEKSVDRPTFLALSCQSRYCETTHSETQSFWARGFSVVRSVWRANRHLRTRGRADARYSQKTNTAINIWAASARRAVGQHLLPLHSLPYIRLNTHLEISSLSSPCPRKNPPQVRTHWFSFFAGLTLCVIPSLCHPSAGQLERYLGCSSRIWCELPSLGNNYCWHFSKCCQNSWEEQATKSIKQVQKSPKQAGGGGHMINLYCIYTLNSYCLCWINILYLQYNNMNLLKISCKTI